MNTVHVERSCTLPRVVMLNRSYYHNSMYMCVCSFSDHTSPLCCNEWQVGSCQVPHCSRCWRGEHRWQKC